jgi:hypothetical protein
MDFTQRWLVMIAIATILFAIALLILRINIRSLLIFFVIGISAISLWMVVDARFFAPQRKRRSGDAKSQQQQPLCTCTICNHDYEEMCFQNRCACCLITKNDKVVGHSSSALQ